MKSEKIESVLPIVPGKGTNAGKQMYLINGVHWSKQEPSASDTHVVLEDSVVGTGDDAKTYVNVVGYSRDTRMSINDKIELLTKHDAGYSQAIALLLK